MEKPYPDNGSFYGLGCLREIGLRKSRHIGNFRTKSEFLNKEEQFRQPLKGIETILDRGTVIRSSGGLRLTAQSTDLPRGGTDRWEPSRTQVPIEQNLSIVREVARRRNLEAELSKNSGLDVLPAWSLKLVYKLFRNYNAPYPMYKPPARRLRGSLENSQHSAHIRSAIDDFSSLPRRESDVSSVQGEYVTKELGSVGSAEGSQGSQTSSNHKEASTEFQLRVEIIRAEDIPKMDATGLASTEGCDPYLVLRHGGLEVFRSQVQHETYNPEWNEVFVLDIDAVREPLIMQVWDEDETCNELIGQTTVNFFNLEEGIREERWHALTAENFKAFRTVQAKSDNTHAGQILLAMTLLRRHNHLLHTESSRASDDTGESVGKSTLRTTQWGQAADNSDESIDRKLMVAGDLVQILTEKLQLIMRGINVTAKPHLFSALDSLLIAQKRKVEGNHYDARMFLEQAAARARKVVAAGWQEQEDKMLASKVLWAALCLIHEANPKAAWAECSKLLTHIEQWPDLQTALDDELTPSDHDRKEVRSSRAAQCCCTENHPGARAARHRILSDVRSISSAMVEELPTGPQPLRFRRTPRENTVFPGPAGRDVDVCLELLSASAPLCLAGHYQAVNAVAISENLAFSASSDQTIRVWDLTTLQCVEVLDLHHHGRINCLCIGPGYRTRQLYSGADDMSVKAFDISTLDTASPGRTPCIHTLRHHQGPVQCLCLHDYVPRDRSDRTEKGWRLLSGSADRQIHIYKAAFIGTDGRADPDDPRPVGVLRGHRSAVTSIVVARERVYSGSLDTTVRVWDLHTLEPLLQYGLDGDIANGLSVVCGRLYVATSDQDVHVLDAGDLTVLTKLEGHSAYVYCLAPAVSTLPLRLQDHVQITHPIYKAPDNPRIALTYDSYAPGQTCARWSKVTIGVRKARDVEAADIRPDCQGSSDPEARVEVGGPVRVYTEGGQGMKHVVESREARTRVLKETLKPRWNETFTFIVPELPDRFAATGSSVASVPVTLSLWDWNATGYDHLGHWRGTLGHLMRHPVSGELPVAGADGSGEPDGEDYGGWVDLSPEEVVVGRDAAVALGMRVGISAEGREWMEERGLEDESGGLAGTVCVLAQDSLSCKVLWEKTKGASRNGQVYPDGWQSAATYSTGRYGRHYLAAWDERPGEHGAAMLFCHVAPAVRGEEGVLAPHRALLASGSDDETVRVHDLACHACVAVLEGEHSNKVSALAVAPGSNRLVSASQDSTLKVW